MRFLRLCKKIYDITAYFIGSMVILCGSLGAAFVGYILFMEEWDKFKTRRQCKNGQ